MSFLTSRDNAAKCLRCVGKIFIFLLEILTVFPGVSVNIDGPRFIGSRCISECRRAVVLSPIRAVCMLVAITNSSSRDPFSPNVNSRISLSTKYIFIRVSCDVTDSDVTVTQTTITGNVIMLLSQGDVDSNF